jgi:hypothetical protein
MQVILSSDCQITQQIYTAELILLDDLKTRATEQLVVFGPCGAMGSADFPWSTGEITPHVILHGDFRLYIRYRQICPENCFGGYRF